MRETGIPVFHACVRHWPHQLCSHVCNRRHGVGAEVKIERLNSPNSIELVRRLIRARVDTPENIAHIAPVDAASVRYLNQAMQLLNQRESMRR